DTRTGLFLGRGERRLELLDGGQVGLERLGEHRVVDAGAEHGDGHGHGAGVGAAECRERHGGRCPLVVLVVHEALGEDEHVAGDEVLGVELAGGVDEADGEGAVEDEQQLGGARVGVGRVDGARWEHEPGVRHALPVERGELGHGGLGEREGQRRQRRWVEAGVGEVVAGDVHRHADHRRWLDEVGEDVRVAGHGGHRRGHQGNRHQHQGVEVHGSH
uniref:Uncharacterized protein n=1 Tax=Triticum urartu TaxID=4572 RepID=A0A8R7Q089_TRIUA